GRSTTTSETAKDDLENEEKRAKGLRWSIGGQFKKATKTKEKLRKEKLKKDTQNFLSGWQKIAPYFRFLSQDQMKNLLEKLWLLLGRIVTGNFGCAVAVISHLHGNDRLHIEHLMEKNHIEVLSTEQDYVQCFALDGYWKAAIKGRTWTPINTSATLPIVESLWNSELRKTEHMDMVIEYTMKNIEDLPIGLEDKVRAYEKTVQASGRKRDEKEPGCIEKGCSFLKRVPIECKSLQHSEVIFNSSQVDQPVRPYVHKGATNNKQVWKNSI
ncbi:hypothetical protein IFM89_031162, partial [Coptis chinensis]